jgi:tRNA modification GTPase
MAVIGRPNVGKSSLMNCLIEKDRVIVTAVPGTTRDIIEEMINIKGLPVIIMDTAGLRDAQEEVEKIGIEKTNRLINEADIILFLVDLADAIEKEDREIFTKIEDKKFIIVQNKVDIQKTGTQSFLPDEWKNRPTIKVSAKLGTNIDTLKEKILTLVVGERGVNKEIEIVPNLRQKEALEKCLVALNRAEHALRQGTSVEIIAVDISEAMDRLNSVIGYTYKDDILDQIFSRFCIGK